MTEREREREGGEEKYTGDEHRFIISNSDEGQKSR